MKMSIQISNVTQIDEGGTNPKTELFEQPLWELTFETGEKRILGKPKMEEYLSKAYEKTVHHFKRRISTLTSGTKITQWSVVFTDYDDILLATPELCDKLYKGHQRKDEEKYKKLDEELVTKRGLVSEAITKAQEHSQHRITTPDEREQLDKNRDKIKEEENLGDFRDLIRKDALPHPDKTGYDEFPSHNKKKTYTDGITGEKYTKDIL
jgi:hypothetical protein